MSKILIATGNMKKIEEFKFILTPLGYEIYSLKDMKSTHVVIEDSDTFEGNSLKKAIEYSKLFKCCVIAEDSGIEVDALNNEPGVYSARFAGDDCNDEKNNLLLHERMVGIENRKCKYVSVITIYGEGHNKSFRGELKGNISNNISSVKGFGYDVLFELPDGRIVSEIDKSEKNKISHRFNSTIKLLNYLKGE